MITLLVFPVLLLLGIGFYALSVNSRRSYVCPECGERITTEYLDAKRCNLCGAPLQKEFS